MRSQKTVIDKIFDDLPSFSWIRLPFLLKFQRKRTSQLLPNNNKNQGRHKNKIFFIIQDSKYRKYDF